MLRLDMLDWSVTELLTPTITTSYFSPSLSLGEKGGESLGSGGAKEGKILRFREAEECSVKTGISCSDDRV